MKDYAFYNAGFREPTGWRRIIVPFRRLLRRLLRPMLFRQSELMAQMGLEIEQLRSLIVQTSSAVEQLRGNQGQMSESIRVVQGSTSDILATKRRLCAIEDHLIAQEQREAHNVVQHAAYVEPEVVPQ